MSRAVWIERHGPETVVCVDLTDAKVNGTTASISLSPMQAINLGREAQDNQAGLLMWFANLTAPKHKS